MIDEEDCKMKRFSCLMVVALMCACVTLPASAESNYALFLQYYDGSDTESSFGGGLKADWLIGESAWGVETRLTYMGDLGVDTAPYEEIVGDLDLMALPVDLGLNYHFMENKNLWLGAGLTYAFLDVNNGSVDDEWGWYGTLGYQTGEPGGNWSFFAEAVYRQIQGDVNTGFDLDTFDTSLNGLGLGAGIAYRF
jgi:hypothetical protein